MDMASGLVGTVGGKNGLVPEYTKAEINVYIVLQRNNLPRPGVIVHSVWLRHRDARLVCQILPGCKVIPATARKEAAMLLGPVFNLEVPSNVDAT